MERNLPEVEVEFEGSNQKKNLFAGQGYRIHEAKMVNRGDSFSVHHLPEEWTDEVFGGDREPRAGRSHTGCTLILTVLQFFMPMQTLHNQPTASTLFLELNSLQKDRFLGLTISRREENYRRKEVLVL